MHYFYGRRINCCGKQSDSRISGTSITFAENWNKSQHPNKYLAALKSQFQLKPTIREKVGSLVRRGWLQRTLPGRVHNCDRRRSASNSRLKPLVFGSCFDANVEASQTCQKVFIEIFFDQRQRSLSCQVSFFLFLTASMQGVTRSISCCSLPTFEKKYFCQFPISSFRRQMTYRLLGPHGLAYTRSALKFIFSIVLFF